MKYIFGCLILLLFFFSAFVSLPTAFGGSNMKPENLKMSLAWIADAKEQNQYIFVISDKIAFRTLEGLKDYIKTIVPANSTLTWDPGCNRTGNEPLLNSENEMDGFKKFCEENNVKFVLVPSG